MSTPGVFGLPHLSEDAVAAYADGVLSASASDRARRHCAECDECATAVRGQREAAMMLRSARVPSLPSGLLARLAGLPMSTSLPPPAGGLPTAMGPNGEPVLIAHSQPRGRGGRMNEQPREDPLHGDTDTDGDDTDSSLGVDSRALVPPTRGRLNLGFGSASSRSALSRAVLPVGIGASAAALRLAVQAVTTLGPTPAIASPSADVNPGRPAHGL